MLGLEIPAWAVGVGIIIIAASIGGALKRLIGGESGSRHARARMRQVLGQLTEEPDSRLRDEVEDMQRRLAELEERLDFAERLLAKQRDAERLAPPKG